VAALESAAVICVLLATVALVGFFVLLATVALVLFNKSDVWKKPKPDSFRVGIITSIVKEKQTRKNATLIFLLIIYDKDNHLINLTTSNPVKILLSFNFKT
jgi:hypothetical protein